MKADVDFIKSVWKNILDNENRSKKGEEIYTFDSGDFKYIMRAKEQERIKCQCEEVDKVINFYNGELAKFQEIMEAVNKQRDEPTMTFQDLIKVYVDLGNL